MFRVILTKSDVITVVNRDIQPEYADMAMPFAAGHAGNPDIKPNTAPVSRESAKKQVPYLKLT